MQEECIPPIVRTRTALISFLHPAASRRLVTRNPVPHPTAKVRYGPPPVTRAPNLAPQHPSDCRTYHRPRERLHEQRIEQLVLAPRERDMQHGYIDAHVGHSEEWLWVVLRV